MSENDKNSHDYQHNSDACDSNASSCSCMVTGLYSLINPRCSAILRIMSILPSQSSQAALIWRIRIQQSQVQFPPSPIQATNDKEKGISHYEPLIRYHFLCQNCSQSRTSHADNEGGLKLSDGEVYHAKSCRLFLTKYQVTH